MRPRTACSACRKRQRRCTTKKASANGACDFCTRNKHDCSLKVTLSDSQTSDTSPTGVQDARSATSIPISPSSSQQLRLVFFPPEDDVENERPAPPKNSTVSLPPVAACIEIASAYFVYIHDTSHSIFHRPSFMNDLACGTISRPIILCVVALAARFSNHPCFASIPPRQRGSVYAREAERQLDLHSVSLNTLYIAVLLGAFYGTEGDSLHESLYYTVACRIGCLMNVPDCLGETPLNREIGIRLWWTLNMIDVWSSLSVHLPRLLVPKDDIPYPVSETEFLGMRRSHIFHSSPGPTQQTERTTSVLVQKIKLNSLLSKIAELNDELADGSLSGHDAQSSTKSLARKLNEWQQGLPDSLVNTQENLITQSASGCGGAFVALHIGFYHFSQLLYYQYLHRSTNAASLSSPGFPEIDDYAEKCRASSTAFCELLYAAQSLPGAEVYYSMVGHALVIASTVQLHILLFSEDDVQIDAARQRLERNFLVLLGLQNLWRTIDHSFGRFKEFHAACVRAKENPDDPSSTFRLDRWMLKFLMEFSKPVEQRVEPDSYTPNEFRSQPRQRHDSCEQVQQDLRCWTMQELGIDLEQDQAYNPMLNWESWKSWEGGELWDL